MNEYKFCELWTISTTIVVYVYFRCKKFCIVNMLHECKKSLVILVMDLSVKPVIGYPLIYYEAVFGYISWVTTGSMQGSLTNIFVSLLLCYDAHDLLLHYTRSVSCIYIIFVTTSKEFSRAGSRKSTSG